MKSTKIWANLAVKDIQRTIEFYTKMGFKPNNNHNMKELTSFLFGEDDFIINFFIEDKLSSAMKGPLSDMKKGNEVMFSLSAADKDEVNKWSDKARNAGATIFREPSVDENGYYYCGFSDPDGHMFNVLSMEEMM